MDNDTHIISNGYLTGKLLIASPAIGDPRFDRAVVFLCAHSQDHAMGIILNKPMGELRLPTLFEQLDIKSDIQVADRAVLAGGPVDRDRGFVLHSSDYLTDDTTAGLGPDIGLTATKDILEAMASDHPPRLAMLALGYAGWNEGQLEDELQANAWLVTDADEELIFGEDYKQKWQLALKKLGVTPEFLTASSGHA